MTSCYVEQNWFRDQVEDEDANTQDNEQDNDTEKRWFESLKDKILMHEYKALRIQNFKSLMDNNQRIWWVEYYV